MSATLISEMSVSQARRRLANTSRMSSEQISELEKIVAAFHASRPRDRSCVCCGSMRWSEHTTADGDASWACAGCHRPASLTVEAWREQRDAKEAQDAEAQARIAADTPPPRAQLTAALQRRAEAAAVLERLEAALPAAREAMAAAQLKYDDAVAAMQAAEQTAIQRFTTTLMGGPAGTGTVSVTDACRGRLRLAQDELQAARGAKALLDDQAHYARNSVTRAEAAVHAAALRVLSSEELEDLLSTAVSARADYLNAIGGLAWLIRNHAVPNGDVRPHQLTRGTDSPPAQWREAAAADGGLAAKLNALMEDRT